MVQIMVRVYGIWIDEMNRILVSDERIGDMEFTKFPGGGLEPGEGTIDALKREWVEELNTPIEVIKHVYTTDFFQASAFHKNTQIISVYYRVKPIIEPPLTLFSEKQPFSYTGEREEIFRWLNWDLLHPDMLTFPIDKKVVSNLLLNH